MYNKCVYIKSLSKFEIRKFSIKCKITEGKV